MTLSGEEFACRLLQHVLPGGFVRMRHYGLLANRGRAEKLALCRRLLGLAPVVVGVVETTAAPRCCGVCGEGLLVVVRLLPREVWVDVGSPVGSSVGEDSS